MAGKTNTDWAETWGVQNGTDLFCMEYVLVEISPDQPFTILTHILVTCNKAATKRYHRYEIAGLDWLGRMIITEAVAEFATSEDIRLILEDQFPQVVDCKLVDNKGELGYDVHIRCQRLGEDNGKDQLVNVKNYLSKVRDQARGRLRKLTEEETARLAEILARP